MLQENVKKEYELWLEKATNDIDLIRELKQLNEDQIYDAFYRDLEFGTGGLRGLIGAGTNRMNVYTVAKASQGLADYVIANYKPEDRTIAISRDSRIKSDVFAFVAARVFAANGIKVYIYPEISPVPTLSFATRYYKCAAGVMITASHNPSKYNGYKVYGDDGCQITTQGAKDILSNISKIDIFNGVKTMSLDEGFEKGLIEYIPPKVLTAFIEEVKKLSMVGDEEINKDFSIVYSPLHGTGLIPVTRTLQEMGYKNIIVVKEQELPDGYFTTCPFPNPEIKEAMQVGMEYAKKYNADLLLATDPDCDRVGLAIRDGNDYRLVSGDETGILLFNYICERLVEQNRMPKDPVFVKTIVTSDMANKVAQNYGVRVIDVLTGFKFIGEQIGLLEKNNAVDSFVFGCEESYGVLSGTHVRDKDGVNGAFLICEMFAYYKSHGVAMIDKLNELYDKYGYYYTSLHTFMFEGETGFHKMQNIMANIRSSLENGSYKSIRYFDYINGLNGLPKSNVLKIYFDESMSLAVRPSGTEPKLKIYPTVSAKNKELALIKEKELVDSFTKRFIEDK